MSAIFISALLIVIPAGFGYCVLRSIPVFTRGLLRISAGTVVGVSTFSWLVFWLSWLLGYNRLTIWLAISMLFIAILFFWRRSAKSVGANSLRFDRGDLLIALGCLALSVVITSRFAVPSVSGLRVNAQGVFDLYVHLSQISIFAHREGMPAPNPFFGGSNLVYPFLVNLYSSMFIKLGLSIESSVIIPMIALLTTLFILLYGFMLEIGKSRRLAFLYTLLLCGFGATLGFLRFLLDYINGNQGFWTLLNSATVKYDGSPQDKAGFFLASFFRTIIIPQRSILIGLPLLLIIILLVQRSSGGRNRRVFLAGVLAGIMPLCHGHACLVIVLCVSALLLTRRDVAGLLFFAAVAAITAAPGLIYFMRSESISNMISWNPFWLAGEDLLSFWIKNTGLIIPFLLYALFKEENHLARLLAVCGVFLFVAANLFQFAPWQWDNTKIFFFAFVLFLPCICLQTGAIWATARSRWIKYAVVVLVGLHTLSGLLGAWRVLVANPKQNMWTERYVELSKKVREYSDENSVVLLNPGRWNRIEILSGRAVYVTSAWSLWSHGLKPTHRMIMSRAYLFGITDKLVDVAPTHVLIDYNDQRTQPRSYWKLLFESDGFRFYELPGGSIDIIVHPSKEDSTKADLPPESHEVESRL